MQAYWPQFQDCSWVVASVCSRMAVKVGGICHVTTDWVAQTRRLELPAVEGSWPS